LRVVGNFKRIDQHPGLCQLIQNNLGGYAETAIGKVVVPNSWVRTVVRCPDACNGINNARNAVGRQRHSDHNIVGVIVVDNSANNQIARLKNAVGDRRRTRHHYCRGTQGTLPNAQQHDRTQTFPGQTHFIPPLTKQLIPSRIESENNFSLLTSG